MAACGPYPRRSRASISHIPRIAAIRCGHII
jgi:hypothetical protein